MPRLTDFADIRARLEIDRAWAAFSLADLDPGQSEHAHWFGPLAGTSVVLVYDAYDPPIVVCHGNVDECNATLAEPEVRALTSHAYLNMTPEQSVVLSHHFGRFDGRRMVRMLLHDVALSTPPQPVARLGLSDLDALQALYAEEPPAFFLPSQLRDGVYFGVREGTDLVAVAGTHVVSRAASVAALGNVHTRRDRRGRGLAMAVTGAVVRELRQRNTKTSVLNIVATNDAARRVYERVGFREYCLYDEGVATR
ncbi:MAG: GNAT family N-acetyltransferase [Vicinamibacterales bacterium]